MNQTKPNQNLQILENFTDCLGIQYDSVHALEDTEVFRRKHYDPNKSTQFDELAYLGKRYGINFISRKAKIEEVLKTVSSLSPVAIFTEKFGWILISSSLGPFVRIVQISNSITSWILKRKLKVYLNQKAKVQDYPEWISIDNNFFNSDTVLNHLKDYKGLIRRFIHLEKKDIWAITIYSLAIGILSLIIPIGVQSLVNILNFGTLYQPILVLTFLVIIALSFVGLMNVLQSFIAELIQQRLFVRLAARVTRLIPKAKHSAMEKHYNSETPNYFLDIAIIQKSVAFLLTNGLGILLQTIIGLLVLMLYHPIFLVFNIIIIGAVIGIIFYLIGPIGIETSIKESKSKHKLASWLEEMINNPTIFRSEKTHIFANLRTENLTRQYIQSRHKHFLALVRQMIGFVSLQAFGSGLLFGIGGWLVIKGEITLGQLIAAEIIVTKILDNLSKFTKYLESYYDLCASLDKINQLLDFPEEPEGKEPINFPVETPISVKIEDLVYNGTRTKISGLTLFIEKGAIVVLQDKTRKCSSKLLDLLYGFYSPDSGNIEVNKVFLQDVSLSEWRNHVTLLNNLEVLSGTIADNVKLNKLSSDIPEIRKELERVGFGNQIKELPDGLHTEILRNGYPLTKEELALLVLARTFLTKPKLVLVDGILEYLTHENLKRIFSIFQEEKKYSTFIIASNDQEILKIADQVYQLKDGKAIEKGKGIV